MNIASEVKYVSDLFNSQSNIGEIREKIYFISQISTEEILCEYLFEIIKIKNYKLFELLLLNTINLNKENDKGETPLIAAISTDDIQFAELIILSGGKIDTPDRNNKTALIHSIFTGNLDVTDLLIKYDADLSYENKESLGILSLIAISNIDNDGRMLNQKYSLAKDTIDIYQRIIKSLKDRKFNINSKCSKGRTALFYAITKKNLNLVKVLLRNGASPDLEMNGTNINLRMAVKIDSTDIFNELISHDCKVDYVDDGKMFAESLQGPDKIKFYEIIKMKNHAEIISDEISVIKGKKENISTYMYSKRINGIDDTKSDEILDSKVDSDNRDKVIEIEEHILGDKLLNNNEVEKNDSKQEAKNTSKKQVKTKLKNGKTSLIVAVAKGDIDEVQKLLSKRANVNKRDDDGRSPLMYACIKGHSKIVEKLIAYKADIELRDDKGNKPIILAVKSGDAASVKALLAKGAIPDARIKGKSTLMMAAEKGYDDVIEELLDFGVDPMSKDFKGRSAARYAEIGGHKKLSTYLNTQKRRTVSRFNAK